MIAVAGGCGFTTEGTEFHRVFQSGSLMVMRHSHSGLRINKYISALLFVPLCSLWLIQPLATPAAAEDFPEIVNSQPGDDGPPTPEEAAAAITFPDGDANWKVTLFAGEPEVQQPIAFDFDDRGRLWVAENYSYAGGPYDEKHRDRVVILEDVDGDGRHDRRTVFWDKGWMLTGLTWGFGGLWVLNDGTLSFIPDQDGDDVPDGEPLVMLDGWTYDAGHNFVNGLLWGPDGWLYGRHGITDTSFPAIPGTPQQDRTPMNCGIWRFHPTRKVFEVVCQGTTNPWGMDFDEQGQLFFTNNVIGHLWHAIPGAHYQRMFGVDFNPHLYELIDQHADHYHWDTTGTWTDSRDGVANSLGGGHSHCGGMIYLGDNWPAKFRGSVLMCNTHGRRVNQDILERHGSGYVAKHADDVLLANQPWFRGIDLKYGPRGEVYLSDWVDNGECHDHDGVHRTSGRIYRITYGTYTIPLEPFDLAALTNEQLVERLTSRNEWHVRHAQRLLQERATLGEVGQSLKEYLTRWRDDGDMTDLLRLRLLWTLYVASGCDETYLLKNLDSEDEHVRGWAVRLLVDDASVSRETPPTAAAPVGTVSRKTVSRETVSALNTLAAREKSPLVRLALASALQRLPLADRWVIAGHLAGREEDAADHNLPLMIWYGLEPAVPENPPRAVSVTQQAKIPLVREFITRRLTSDLDAHRDALAELLAATRDRDDAFAVDVLRGMAAALQGVPQTTPPDNWSRVADVLSMRSDETLRRLTQELSLIFGDGRAMEALIDVARNTEADRQARTMAIENLVAARATGFDKTLLNMVGDRIVQEEALNGLAAYDHPKTAETIIQRWGQIRAEARDAAVTTLAARPAWARALLKAVESGTIDAALISGTHARQIISLGDDSLTKLLEQVWGVIDRTDAQKQQAIELWHQKLEPSLADADLSNGRALYQKTCATCHKLYGEGGQIGPDLTGSNRNNLGYLLENILDPNRAVPRQWTTTTILLNDGRVINGVVTRRTDQTWTVQTAKEEVIIPAGEIEQSQATNLSLMPEGQLNTLRESDVRDLIGYLQSQGQVALPR
jgi:putative membrane-bound dehydrogenase-like protein